MAQTDVFALDKSDLNGFLLADIGLEGNGMALSVMSLFARVGLDPWQEAGRMARLPRSAAADALARLIASMPASPWPMSDATPIAARLVALLPGRGVSPVVVTKAMTPNWRWVLLAVVTTVLLAQTVIQLTASKADPPSASISPPVAPPTAD